MAPGSKPIVLFFLSYESCHYAEDWRALAFVNRSVTVLKTPCSFIVANSGFLWCYCPEISIKIRRKGSCVRRRGERGPKLHPGLVYSPWDNSVFGCHPVLVLLISWSAMWTSMDQLGNWHCLWLVGIRCSESAHQALQKTLSSRSSIIQHPSLPLAPSLLGSILAALLLVYRMQ